MRAVATDRTLQLFTILQRNLYTFLRHASPATVAPVVSALRLTASEIDELEALRSRARRMSRVEFEDTLANTPLESAHDPFRRLRRAQKHRSAAVQARESAAFATLVGGKRLALVGPSISSVGGNRGAAIEACDVVVRMNFQWPIPAPLVADVGTRMDVLYHCCNGDFPVGDLLLPGFAETRFVCWQANPDSFWLEAHCLDNGIPSLDVSSVYAELEELLRTAPFTGTVAIEHLLRFPIAELHLTGISFGVEPYYGGYKGHGASGSEAVKAVHRIEPQVRYFREVIARDPRLHLDPALERLRAG
jgi:hypothetical protein